MAHTVIYLRHGQKRAFALHSPLTLPEIFAHCLRRRRSYLGIADGVVTQIVRPLPVVSMIDGTGTALITF